jgi:hypothetical protein
LNSRLNLEQHPYSLIDRISARRGDDLTFSYSRYEVAPSGLQWQAPRSKICQVSCRDITPLWLEACFTALSPKEELAWHSWVEWNGAGYHIPMIDFVSSSPDAVLLQISGVVSRISGLRGEFLFFETGRSFHAYFPDLIPESRWPVYLEQLLDLNRKCPLPVIDERWAGYSLKRGFCALRWSHNTRRYQAMPRLLSLSRTKLDARAASPRLRTGAITTPVLVAKSKDTRP